MSDLSPMIDLHGGFKGRFFRMTETSAWKKFPIKYSEYSGYFEA